MIDPKVLDYILNLINKHYIINTIQRYIGKCKGESIYIACKELKFLIRISDHNRRKSSGKIKFTYIGDDTIHMSSKYLNPKIKKNILLSDLEDEVINLINYNEKF